MLNPLSALSDNIRIDKNKCICCGECTDRCTLDNLRLQVAPCVQQCPLGVNSQGYVQLVSRGECAKALEEVRKVLPFVGILGYVCNAPCETKCTRCTEGDQAVTIRSLKRYLYDSIGRDNPYQPVIGPARKETIAVIGGGPAGMYAAVDLRRRGFNVTLFEKEARLGGKLWTAIPRFRLPLEVVDDECAILERAGVEVKLNTEIGKDISAEKILNDFDAVFLATGLSVSNGLGLNESQLDNVYYASDFLRQTNENTAPALGKSVIVIGGGEVAVDSALTARRNGVENITMIALEQLCEMPVSEDSKAALANAGVKILSGYGIAGIANGNGGVSIQTKHCAQVFDADGCFAPLFDEEVAPQVSAEQVIVAIGQKADCNIFKAFGLDAGYRSQLNLVTRQSSIAKLFIGGDLFPGANTVVQSMADAREASESIQLFLDGLCLEYNRANTGKAWIKDYVIDSSGASKEPRADLAADIVSASLIEKGLGAEQAITQAKRCANCGGPVGYHRTCWSCLPCEISCKQEALYVDIPYSMS